MTSRDFAYWLQGFFEIQDPSELTGTQIEMIKAHLNLVFIHEIDPSIDKFHSKEEVDKMNEIHNNPTSSTSKWGPCPGPNYELSPLHGWYIKSEGIPKC